MVTENVKYRRVKIVCKHTSNDIKKNFRKAKLNNYKINNNWSNVTGNEQMVIVFC